jgi:hypothetical protein
MPTPDDIESRIERIPFSGCWLWMGATVQKGYGQLQIGGKFKRAHRVVFEMLRGQIPEGLNLLHHCDVPCCVNPDHLYPGTQKQNTADAIARGRFRAGWHNAAKTHCSRGHEFTKANTGHHATGHRFCRACHSLTVRRYQQRTKGALPCLATA